MTIYTHSYYGLMVSTGDIICTRDGEENSLFGKLWGLLGKLVPGEVDHCLLYIGPGGRCVESAARGVVVFEMPGDRWDSKALFSERWLLDTFHGVAYPFANRNLPSLEEGKIRQGVADFCLAQAANCKPYNINFFDSQKDGAFYCSQLIYKAFIAFGINLNTDQGVPKGRLGPIVFPQEIWNACPHHQPEAGFVQDNACIA
jgi:hypothetical protein